MAEDKHPIADQFSDEEMEQIKRYGQALGGGSTDFSDEVEKHLPKYEAHYAKMRAAQMGLAPEPLEQAGAQQATTIQQQAATQGQVQAAKAQAGQVGPAPPPAPGNPVGVSEPYPAEREETPPGIPEAPSK